MSGEVALLAAAGGPPRAAAALGDAVVVDRGVDTPWSVLTVLPADPVPDAVLRSALAWCRSRDAGRGFRVEVPLATAAAATAAGLSTVDELPVFAVPAHRVADVDGAARPRGLEIGPPRDLDELAGAYGAWMDDLPLARGLVTAADLARPDRRFLVGRVDGEPVGCALVWLAGGTAYLSGIGVVAAQRGRGYGRALTAAAARLGAHSPGVRSGGGGSPGVDLVWMHASADGAALYARMGFTRVDTHLQLAP